MPAGHRAGSRGAALCWPRGRARHRADAPEPLAGSCPFPAGSPRLADPRCPDPGRALRERLFGLRYQETRLAALRAGRHVGVDVVAKAVRRRRCDAAAPTGRRAALSRNIPA
ncbi:hypothetical protein GCM10009716_35380 [Streptomyces sodiiphilus]|uniref:Uncharacterized protein n=1 Tax=Streptomyces sodiiphilus TaxID=226217 RepID=A0ABN3J9Z1_9ACTN